ncbi:hypothetical protein D3C73_958670 [compost metagenome]
MISPFSTTITILAPIVAPVERVNTPIMKVIVAYTHVLIKVAEVVKNTSLHVTSCISNPYTIPPVAIDTPSVNKVSITLNSITITYLDAKIALRLWERINRNFIVPWLYSFVTEPAVHIMVRKVMI